MRQSFKLDTVSAHVQRQQKNALHPPQLVRSSQSKRKLVLGGFPGRRARKLYGRIVIMQGSQSLTVLGQKRENESEMM
jgi:hypothetical protein